MIIFRKLSFKNFLSTGTHPTTIELDKTKTTLVHGVNGSGKSTILDALTYALFNKPFRKINIPQLVNSSNKKDLLTEVEFSIGNNNFTVVRGQKPKVFQVYRNGELIDSKASDKDNQVYLEQNILKMNYKTFSQVVILGSANYVPFMALNGAGRKECVEDFLDIRVFSVMSTLAKARLSDLRASSNLLKGDLSNLEYKMDIQKERLEEIKSKSEDDIKELETNIDKLKTRGKDITKEVEDLQSHRDEVDEQISELLLSNPNTKWDKFNTINIELKQKLKNVDTNIAFYQDNDHCHACGQSIEQHVKDVNISKYEAEKVKLVEATNQAGGIIDKLNSKLSEVKEKRDYVQGINNEIYKRDTEIKSIRSSIQESQAKIQSIQSDTSSLTREEDRLKDFDKERVELQEKYDSVLDEIRDNEIVVNLLKDSGIKTQIVRKYLPVMNKFIRKYLGDLELDIHFTLDEEFNEKVSSPMYQDFSYASFSEGQKSRIDLALMLTWREIGKLKNSVSTNLLILDEVFSSSLDEVGKELLLQILRWGLDNKQNILVVDHTLSATFKEKFDRTVEVIRSKGFSTYVS